MYFKWLLRMVGRWGMIAVKLWEVWCHLSLGLCWFVLRTDGELGDSLVVVFVVFEADWVDLGLALIRVLSWGWWGLVAGSGSYIRGVVFVFVDDTDCVGFELDYWLWGVVATNYSLFSFIAMRWRVVYGVVGSGLEVLGKRRFVGLFI